MSSYDHFGSVIAATATFPSVASTRSDFGLPQEAPRYPPNEQI